MAKYDAGTTSRSRILVFALLASLACATSSLYQSWGDNLVELPSHNRTVDDVSFLLGTPPSRCDRLNATTPRVGIHIDARKPSIVSAVPNGPGERAGLRAGDNIVTVSGVPTPTGTHVHSSIQRNARVKQPLEIETNRGVFTVYPTVPTAMQCYWEVDAGAVHQAGSSAYVNAYAGSAGFDSRSYQRFFRASCRVEDGYIVACRANWQE
jgi:hypothetical protein